MKRLLFITLLVLSCSRTGLDEDDGGVDGGIDAGVDGGSFVPQCVSANDCPPTTITPVCWAGQVAQHSCVSGRCVFDCDGARTCTAGECLICAGESCSACQQFDAPPNAGRLSRSCGAVPELIGGFNFTVTNARTCSYALSSDAGIAGTIEGRGAGLAQVLGETCTLHVLVTALNRVELGCGDCTYLLEWP